MPWKRIKDRLGIFSVSLNIYTMNTRRKNLIHTPIKKSEQFVAFGGEEQI